MHLIGSWQEHGVGTLHGIIFILYKASVSFLLTDGVKQSCVENLFSILCGKEQAMGRTGEEIHPKGSFHLDNSLPPTVKAITSFAICYRSVLSRGAVYF